MQQLSKVYKTVTTAKTAGIYVGVIAVLVMMCVSGSSEGTFIAFGPEDFVRAAGKPVPVTRNFTALHPALSYTLHIDNGGSHDTFARVSSAVVTLNGVEVARPSDFSQHVRVIEKPVRLAATNTLIVELRSAPGSGFTLQIFGTGQENTPPVAHAGPDQTVVVGQTVTLDGSRSTDVDGDPLLYRWSFVVVPTGSQAALSDPTLVHPTFVVDRPGTYTVQLIANDGKVDSAPDTVTITTTNSLPVANAGRDQTVFVGTTVQLDGSQSSDVDGDSLLFEWSFRSRPSGSTATLSDPTVVNPTFIVDKPGTYVVQLIVNDGLGNSAPAMVTITTMNSRPAAHAGPDQTVFVGATVSLDGSQSSDVDGDPLTYRWSFTALPVTSATTLSGPHRGCADLRRRPPGDVCGPTNC